MTAHASHTGRQAAVGVLGKAWAGQNAWTVLDTGFASVLTFLELWNAWRTDAQRPRVLHYVGVLPVHEALGLAARLQDTGKHHSPTAALAHTLAARCWGLDQGFHRILLEDGHVSLTLCVDDLPTAMALQDMQADTVVACEAAAHWDKWTLKAVARHCKRGTTLLFPGQAIPDASLLQTAGFVLQPACAPDDRPWAVFNPRWTLRNSRRSSPTPFPFAGRCAVVGAGIAGASIARALAVRGWQVDVLDRAPQPAAGASGLPVGLVVPHHSSDDSPRSRMSRAGTRLMLDHAARLLQKGMDWNDGGVLELHIDNTPLNAVEAEVLSQTLGATSSKGWARPSTLGHTPGLWHPFAAWIKPQQLVTRWLDHANIRFIGNAAVHRLARHGPQWQLLGADGAALAQADAVVFANAHGCVSLLQRIASDAPSPIRWVPDVLEKLDALQTLHGTTSFGPCPTGAHWPPYPVNGHGSLVSGVPSDSGMRWYAGSTFRTTAPQAGELAQEHAANRSKLRSLLPQVEKDVASQFENHQVQAWQGTRCVTHDRLPLVGPLEDAATPTLWLSAGMGARGLSFSALCAELTAAWMCGEPLPIENNRARSLGTHRSRRQRA